jgi:hypothetical protein
MSFAGDTTAHIPANRAFKKLMGRQSTSVPASKNRGISALEKKYREVLGERKRLLEAQYEWQGKEGFEAAAKYYDDRLRHYNDTLAHIEKSADLLDPNWSKTRQRLMAPLLRRASPRLSKGEFKTAFIRIMRSADGVALEVSEIAARVARELALPINRRDQRLSLYATTYGALRSAYDRGLVICLEGSPGRWVLVDSNSHLEAIRGFRGRS